MALITGNTTIQGTPRSILLIQLGDIGDVVLTAPTIRALRETYPLATIVVAVWQKAAALLDDCPWLDHVVAVTKESRPLPAEWRFQREFFRKMRDFDFDLAIDLRTGTRGAIMAFFSGARQRIGFYADDGKLWRNRIFTSLLHRDYTPGQHVVDYLLCLLEPFGITTAERAPELTVAAEKQAPLTDLLAAEGVPIDRPLVAVQPFSLWQYKELDEGKYIALIRWLISEKDTAVLVTGAAGERERAAEIVRQCGDRCHNLAGKTTIAMYAALLQRCGLFIGVDSAGLHIAAAVGTPTVSIFGPSAPASWAPRGPDHLVVQKDWPCVPCRRKGCDNSEHCRCLDELTIEEIRLAIEKQIDHKKRMEKAHEQV